MEAQLKAKSKSKFLFLVYYAVCPKCEWQDVDIPTYEPSDETVKVSFTDLMDVGSPVCTECGEHLDATGDLLLLIN